MTLAAALARQEGIARSVDEPAGSAEAEHQAIEVLTLTPQKTVAVQAYLRLGKRL